jgi:hypothetical protein
VGVSIRKVASASPGNADLAADFSSAFQDQDGASSLARFGRAHQSGGAGANHDHFLFCDH